MIWRNSQGPFERFDHILHQDQRVTRLEMGHEHQAKRIDELSARQRQLEEKIDTGLKWLGLSLLGLLVLANLPPEISAPIIGKLVKLLPG